MPGRSRSVRAQRLGHCPALRPETRATSQAGARCHSFDGHSALRQSCIPAIKWIANQGSNLLHFIGSMYCIPVLLFESLVVVTAFGYAYDRPDGVAVVPITTLGP